MCKSINVITYINRKRREPHDHLCAMLSHSVMSDSCDPIDCSPPGSSFHGILQARILEWVAISFSRGSSQPRDRTPLRADSLTAEPQRKPKNSGVGSLSSLLTQGLNQGLLHCRQILYQLSYQESPLADSKRVKSGTFLIYTLCLIKHLLGLPW